MSERLKKKYEVLAKPIRVASAMRRAEKEGEARRRGSLQPPLPELDGRKQLPAGHPLWKIAGSVIRPGHEVVGKEVILAHAAWWRVRSAPRGEASRGEFAVRATSGLEARQLLSRGEETARGTAELYPDRYLINGEVVNPHELLDQQCGFSGEGEDTTVVVPVAPFTLRPGS